MGDGGLSPGADVLDDRCWVRTWPSAAGGMSAFDGRGEINDRRSKRRAWTRSRHSKFANGASPTSQTRPLVRADLADLRRSERQAVVPALVWQPSSPQRATKSFRKRRGTVHARKLAAVAKARLKLEHTRSGRPRFVQPAKFDKCSGQLHVSDAVCRIGLNGFVGRSTSFLVSTAQQMTHCLRVERSPYPRIERA